MTRELVILSDAPITVEQWVSVANPFIDAGRGDGTTFVGGLTQLRLDTGEEIVAFFASRRLAHRREADRMLGEDTEPFAYWTDVTIPDESSLPGDQIIAQLVRACSGRLIERT